MYWASTDDCIYCANWCKVNCTTSITSTSCAPYKGHPTGPRTKWCQCCCSPSPPPPPPSPSPPPPSSSPPPPPSPPPPTPPTNICSAGEVFLQSTVTSCSICTRDYCQSQCSGKGALVTKMSCTPSSLSCRCCCRSITFPSSTTAVGSSLSAAIQ
ncbi:hypothetical protein MKW92_026412 [Papaver armeniacum]|nr:hypothetical protein MKW92_026412 [Papaver armeniacum]